MFNDHTGTPFAELPLVGHSPARVVEHLRQYEHFGMIEHGGGQIRKTGHKPYF